MANQGTQKGTDRRNQAEGNSQTRDIEGSLAKIKFLNGLKQKVDLTRQEIKRNEGAKRAENKTQLEILLNKGSAKSIGQ